MLVIESGQPISFGIASAEFQELTGITWRLFDENGTSIENGTLPTTATSLVINAIRNDVPANATATSRMLVVEYRTPSGTTTVRHFYTVQSLTPLQEGFNSCQTYLKALALVPNMPPMDSWGAATDLQRISALVGAFENLKYLTLREGFEGIAISNNRRSSGVEAASRLADLAPNEWAFLPADFKRAFARAQLIEANHILGYDTPETLRERGVLSYSSGEVKQFFRTQKPIELGVCKAALRVVGRYVEYSRRLERG